MATLTIRNLPDDVHDALRRRAAENRRSVEAEVRRGWGFRDRSASRHAKIHPLSRNCLD